MVNRAMKGVLKAIFSARSIQIAVILRFLLHFFHSTPEQALKNLVAQERALLQPQKCDPWLNTTLCSLQKWDTVFFSELVMSFPIVFSKESTVFLLAI